jgi:predicted N-formylglutamate amidohydrolase
MPDLDPAFRAAANDHDVSGQTIASDNLSFCPGKVEHITGDVTSGILILCDHASNAMPPELQNLGLPETELERHIAYDIGAAWMTRAMADALCAPALLTSFSRLLIDPNRGLDDPTLVMKLSDGAIVPGNVALSEVGISERISRYYTPYDDAISAAITHATAAGHPPAIISLHSFTPVWKTTQRPWHVGVLWNQDQRLAAPLIEMLQLEADLAVGDNEPYFGGLSGDTIDRHATTNGLPDALIEVRQDLISNYACAVAWGLRLAPMIRRCVGDIKLARAAA